MNSQLLERRSLLAGMGAAGLFALVNPRVTTAEDSQESPPLRLTGAEDLETYRVPPRARITGERDSVAIAQVTEIVGIASHTFEFKENSNTPGRLLEKSAVINVPSGAGFVVMVPYFTGAFTDASFAYLRERPMGQFLVSVGLRGNNLVCKVRLTDSNSDDPIYIAVTGVVQFFR